jgi:geranylgeranyl pyrophosphate synthase
MSEPQTNFSKYFYIADRKTFQEVYAVSKLIVNKNVNSKDRHLKKLINLALRNKLNPSDYPFVFKYAYVNVEQDNEKIITLAAAIHLLQTSTFVIDDIFDSSEVRNYDQTIYGKYGVNYAILIGEFLQTTALGTISSELEYGEFSNKPLVLKIFNKALRDLYVGQYLDIYSSANPNIRAVDYYRVISLTTGCFLASIAKCGALLAGKPEAEVRIITKHSYYYGMALQITDDILDLTHNPKLTGKSFGNDLRCRRMRLPYILALRSANNRDSATLRRFLKQKNSSGTEIEAVAKLIEKCGATDACKVIANRYLKKSLKSIATMKSCLTKESLVWLSESLFTIQGLRENQNST